MKVLISGAGVAGPCLAYWLAHHGFEPTIVERAPALRTGGYVIDFWGAGYDVAERMGVLPQILAHGYKVGEVRLVDRDGKKVGGMPVRAFDRITHGRFASVARSDLAAALYRALDGRVETIFGDTITAIEDTGNDVRVAFEHGAPRTFDLVIGADGLHSQVRRLAFGDGPEIERYLGLKVAAFQAEGYRPRDELVYMLHRDVGQEVGRFTMRDDRTMFLFVFTDADPALPEGVAAQKAVLRRTFASTGWETPAILDALDRTDALYIDRVSQIRMEKWSQGRVALVGDAAFCVSLLAGQGTALAMVAAYVLAGELAQARGDHAQAFARYRERLATLITTKQDGARKLSSFFAPPSRFSLFLGNQITKLMAIPFVANLAIGREIRDKIDLPAY